VTAKCAPGGRYYSNADGDLPPCKRCKDGLRGSVLCKRGDHAVMEAAFTALVSAFGPPKVVKDRRAMLTRDVLCVFEYEHVLCEIQLHFRSVYMLKSLSHKAFDLSRLNTDDSVTSSGLRTVMKIPRQTESVDAMRLHLII
jgi:hypothetical protein